MSDTSDERSRRRRASAARARRRAAAPTLWPTRDHDTIRWQILDALDGALVAEVPDHPANDPARIRNRLAREAGVHFSRFVIREL